MPSCTLKSLQEKSVKQIYGMSTARGHAMRGRDRLTDRPLQEHSASPSIHVQGSIKGIERVAAL
eukprot:4713977-Amphidinium_carterae.1